MTKIKVSAFRWVPPFAQGLVRDLRVRWALEEAGLDYDMRLISLGEDQQSAGYRAMQPFGQVPAYEEDGLTLFESGAIVLHIAERSVALMPTEPNARAQTKSWMFAALNTVEPPILFLNRIDMQKDAVQDGGELRAKVLDGVRSRLSSLQTVLEQHDYLVDNRFTAADLLMASVLNILRTTDLVAQMPTLDAYRQRCEARPAYQKALAEQMATFAEHAPDRS